jgi:hypothetical protein
MANPIRTLAAVSWLAAADLALAIHARCTRAVGVTAETPMFRRLNSAVTRADANPHLPARLRDPRCIADDLNRA